MKFEEFKSRLKLINSNDIFEKWNIVINELVMSYYPRLNERQAKLLNCIIHVIWDVGFSNAFYVEVVMRLMMFNKRLFPTRTTINETIKDLCKQKIIRSRLAEFSSINSDGVVLGTASHRVLEISDDLRIETINAMAEIFQSYMNSFFCPRRKYNRS